MLTQARLKELLHYDPVGGFFTFIKNRGTMAHAGCTAGGKITGRYLTTFIDGQSYKLHRLAWLYMTGEWPQHSIDHIDGYRCNNAFSNLRDIPNSKNLQNQRKAHKSNQTGLLGVSIQNGRPKAKITINKKQIHIGYFNTVEEAHDAYLVAKRRLHEYGTL